MKIEMRFDQVLMKPEATVQSKTIIVPDKVHEKDRPCKGTVVEVGPGAYRDGKFHEMTLKKGSVCLFHLFPSLECEIEGVKHYIVRENQAVAVIG